jgi:hypothetical protein
MSLISQRPILTNNCQNRVSFQKTAPKKMKITQSPWIVDLEEEDTKEQVNMDMVESGTNNVEVGKSKQDPK